MGYNTNYMQWSEENKESFKNAIKEFVEQIDKCVNNNKADVPDTTKIENYLKCLQEFDITFHIGEIFWPRCVQYCWAVFAPKKLLHIQHPSQLFKNDGCKGYFVILQYYYVDKRLELSHYNTALYEWPSTPLKKAYQNKIVSKKQQI